MKIDQPPRKYEPSNPNSDWECWLITDDGLHVLVQISCKASEKRAKEILAQLAK